MKFKIKFTDCDGVEHQVKGESETWPEIADSFYRTLKASGYVIDAKQLAEHYDERTYSWGENTECDTTTPCICT